MKKILYSLIILLICSALVCAEQEKTSQIKIPLLYPQKSTAERKTSGVCNKTITVNGLILVKLENVPRLPDADTERYLVEYYTDNKLFYKTNGINENNPGILNFNIQLDTNSIENGEYNLVINFWDKKGPSAIGIKKIIIKNKDEND